jgi:hypothetical protein
MHSNVMLRFMVQALQDPPLCSSTLWTMWANNLAHHAELSHQELALNAERAVLSISMEIFRWKNFFFLVLSITFFSTLPRERLGGLSPPPTPPLTHVTNPNYNYYPTTTAATTSDTGMFSLFCTSEKKESFCFKWVSCIWPV